jgi:hypothetical protein
MTGRVAWHRDHENPDCSRLWDGTAWTEWVASTHGATIAVPRAGETESRPPEERGQVPSVGSSIDVTSAPSLGTSESIDESDWLLRQFTQQQVRHINEVLGDDVGTRLQGSAPIVLESLSGLVVAFDNPRDRDQYGVPLLERLVDLLSCVDAARVIDIQALHFTYQAVIQSACTFAADTRTRGRNGSRSRARPSPSTLASSSSRMQPPLIRRRDCASP